MSAQDPDPTSPHALRAWARANSRAAFDALMNLATYGTSEATRLAAIREVFDRAFGKAGVQDSDAEAAPGAPRIMEPRWQTDKNKATPDPSCP